MKETESLTQEFAVGPFSIARRNNCPALKVAERGTILVVNAEDSEAVRGKQRSGRCRSGYIGRGLKLLAYVLVARISHGQQRLQHTAMYCSEFAPTVETHSRAIFISFVSQSHD